MITIILIIVFLTNYFLYWIIFLKTERKKSKKWDIYTNIYLIIWSASIITIPIINSSFLTGISYFREFWPGFLLIGIILFILGIKFAKLALEINKVRGLAKGNYRLITKGPYQIMRHPMYSAWALVFFGLALILDSLISLIITPFFMLFLGLQGFLEEKYLLLPKFGENYAKYKKKVPNRLFSSPYNVILALIAVFIVYIGILNFYVNV